MEKLIDTEIKILQYCRNVQYYKDGLDTFVKIPEEFTKAQFTVACDSLEEKGMIKTFYCEGHNLQDVSVLDKGQCYLDNLKENQEICKYSCTNIESLIDSISIGKQNRQTTIWNNGVIGQIIDLESNGEFHLIDYIDANTINPLYWGDSNELKNSKIIATGIVGWWLHNKRRNTIGNIKDFYKGYADKCYQDFQNSKQSDPMFMNMDLKKIFFGGIHQNKEKEFIQKSQSLLPFLTTEDIFTINNMIDGYWTIIKDEYENQTNKPINPTNLAMEKQDSISIDLDEEQIAVLAFFSDGKEHFDTPENIENEDYWGICEELENMSLLIAPLTKDNGYKISRKGKKLYKQILSEKTENMSELDYLILNTLRLHGNQINPNSKSSKQIYDFEELSLYTQDEISDCSMKLENMGFISIFRDGGPAYWHKLLDPGRVLLRKYLCGQDSQNNKQNNQSEPDEEEKILGIESILPNALKTKRSIFYFNMAIDKGVIKLENGKLSWVKIGNVGSMSQLAYFCGRVYEYDHTLNGNAGTQFPEIELNALFGVTRLQSLLDQVYKAKKIQSWRRNIDELFE